MIDEKKLIEDFMNNYLVKNDGTWNDAMDRAVELTKAAPKVGEWIPVSERLPEGCSDAEIEVLVTINEEYIEASFDETVPALYYPETKTFHSVYRHRVDITNIVTAWRPLPEPYRKDVE